MKLLKKKRMLMVLAGISLLGLVFLGFGCDGGGGGGDAAGGGGATCEDVSGTWWITAEVDATDCGEGIYTEEDIYVITQDDCNITITDSAGGTYSGTVDGNQINWTASWEEDGGTVTAEISLTISGNSLSGSASWTWTNGVDSCSGTTQITGTSIPPGERASFRFFNNLVCDTIEGPIEFWAYLDICGSTRGAYSGQWSSCETVRAETCSFSLYTEETACGTVSMSGSVSLDPGCVYNYILTLDGPNAVLVQIDECPGDCTTPTPLATGASLESLFDDDSLELLMEVPIEGEGFTSAQ
jgi:hypothetical protein